MRVSIQSFYRNFYGESFARYFVRAPKFNESKIYCQFIVETPKQLYLYTSKNSGIYPCFISTYNNWSKDNLKQKDKSNLVFDRIFFDFDVKDDTADKLKKQINELRGEKGPETKEQLKLKEKLRDLVINKKISKGAIDDAKRFSKIFKNDFGKDLALFFSGSKGCHAYTFFEPVKLVDANETVKYFAKKIKTTYNLGSMDLAANKKPLNRNSRIPYSKHQLTGLTVVPFNTTDDYDDIIEKSLHPQVEIFDIGKYWTDLNKHLQTMDNNLVHNSKLLKPRKNTKIKSSADYSNSKTKDQRKFFRKLLGEPKRTYEEYVTYNCPFPDHTDNNPSFMVYKTGYRCLGCGRKGNYWQFLKDYYNWNNEQVKAYLRSKRPKFDKNLTQKVCKK